MYFFPFKDRGVADRFAEGLSKAGMQGRAGGYFPAYKKNQVTGEEVKKLLFGTTTTGPSRIDIDGGEPWRVTRKNNGDFTVQGLGPISSDTGKSWMEGEMICLQYQKIYSGLEFC